MNIKRKLTSLTAAVALAATTLVPIATSANAEPWNGGHRDGGYPTTIAAATMAAAATAATGTAAEITAAAATAAGTTSTPTAGTSITIPASTSRSASAP